MAPTPTMATAPALAPAMPTAPATWLARRTRPADRSGTATCAGRTATHGPTRVRAIGKSVRNNDPSFGESRRAERPALFLAFTRHSLISAQDGAFCAEPH